MSFYRPLFCQNETQVAIIQENEIRLFKTAKIILAILCRTSKLHISFSFTFALFITKKWCWESTQSLLIR